jgi:hypothetical protein
LHDSVARRAFLDVPEGHPRRLAIGWLLLGLGALIASGLLSVLLVLSRTPVIQDAIPLVDFFHTALVVHVDLSVLIWFLAFAGVIWSLTCGARLAGWGWLALVLSTLGTAMIALAPFTGDGEPIMNNYVPVLEGRSFFTGLLVFALGMTLLVARTLATGFPRQLMASGTAGVRVGVYAAAVTTLLAMLAVLWSYRGLPETLDGKAFYEFLFWGGGHTIQFTYTLLMLAVWWLLAEASGVRFRISSRLSMVLFALAASPAIAVPFIYFSHEVFSPDHLVAFTRLMKYGGLLTLPLGALLTISVLFAGKAPADSKPLRASLICSLALFAAGGVLGFMIHGVNVVIPAHYHGSIVGVTLALMGYTYHLLPRLGFRHPGTGLAAVQPYVYGGGQLLHITGLAWCGGYGVQRKTAGSAQGLENFPEIAGMALMGLGGLVAIVGGVLFLVVAIRAMWPPRGAVLRPAPESAGRQALAGHKSFTGPAIPGAGR